MALRQMRYGGSKFAEKQWTYLMEVTFGEKVDEDGTYELDPQTMPQYYCHGCDRVFEGESQDIEDAPTECPNCGARPVMDHELQVVVDKLKAGENPGTCLGTITTVAAIRLKELRDKREKAMREADTAEKALKLLDIQAVTVTYGARTKVTFPFFNERPDFEIPDLQAEIEQQKKDNAPKL